MNIVNKKAVFVGECMIELSGNISEMSSSGLNMQVNFGGDTLNSAVYFSRLSNNTITTFYSTALGKDNFSKKMISQFKAENINCDYIRQDGTTPPGIYAIETDEKGDRSFSYWRNESPSKSLFLGSNGQKLINGISSSDIFYYSGITAGILDKAQQKELVNLGKSSVVSAFDFNYREKLHFKKKEAQLLFQYINNNIDIHFISYDDVKELFNINNPNEIIQMVSNNKNLILLRYNNQILYKNKLEEIKTITVQHDKALDTTAAGDSFNGSFLALMTNNKNISIEENILKSHSVTREVIKHKGAIIAKRFMPKILN